jgi:drug/metabolite transporter (DMT)-like permease
LSAFTFITPLFGVAVGYVIMDDRLTPAFGVAALLVIAGLISLTGLPRRPLIRC